MGRPPTGRPVRATIRIFERTPLCSQQRDQLVHRLHLQIAREDGPHLLGFWRVDGQGAAGGIVTQRQVAAHPHALGLGGGDLVADPLAGDLPLELRE